ncbi:hypothetical protein HPB47_021721, partial [Ixodes persulcatus]
REAHAECDNVDIYSNTVGQLRELGQQVADEGRVLRIGWVKGHSGIYGNEEANNAARMALEAAPARPDQDQQEQSQEGENDVLSFDPGEFLSLERTRRCKTLTDLAPQDSDGELPAEYSRSDRVILGRIRTNAAVTPALQAKLDRARRVRHPDDPGPVIAGCVAAAPPFQGQPKCGYESCPATKPGMLNVHILAHTHLDLGWLKTVDQYYAGSKNYLANAGVRYIFDGILPELEKDPSRRFIYVETGFFDIWWRHQTDSIKERFNKLVQSGKSADIFTGILPSVYSPPKGFCFDVHCDDEPIVDDPESDEYNVPSRLADFMAYVREQSSATKVNLLYSTPSCYLKSLYEANMTWSVKHDDFFPYASDPHSYWTGYFTSRPAFKYLDRYTNNLFQAEKQLGVAAGPKAVADKDLDVLRKALAVGQHHDAITGTAKQAVASNYVKHISIGLQSSEKYLNSALQRILPLQSGSNIPWFTFCHTLNISACSVTENASTVAMLLYNPQAKPVTSYLRIPVTSVSHAILDKDGYKVPSQVFDIPRGVTEIPGRASKAAYELVFRATLPPVGFETFFLTNEGRGVSDLYNTRRGNTCTTPGAKEMVLSGKTVSVTINCKTGLLTAMTWNSTKINVQQSFYWYEGMKGNNSEFEYRASGAYIFRPKGKIPIPVAKKVQLTNPMGQGDMVQEVRQTFSNWLTQVIRVYKEEDFVEFDWVVGPIPVNDSLGKEIVTRFDTDLKSDGDFYTDSNGREILQRRLNYRPTWPLINVEPVSGNYYPVNSRIYLKDKARNIQFTILTDRSQGGSSLTDGSLEVMVHRRLLHDDAFGVGEALNETYYNGTGVVVRGRHRVFLSPVEQAAQMHRTLAQSMYMAPVLAFAPVKLPDYLQCCRTTYSALAAPLPPNVHLLTLEQWNNETVLLRLEHFYEIKDNAGNLSAAANFSLQLHIWLKLVFQGP